MDTEESVPLGTFVKLWTADGECWGLVEEDEPRIDAAVSRWIDSGETRDTLLLLTLTGGDPMKLRASSVTSWMISTPEGRRREMEITKASDEERDRVKREIGMWDE